MAKTICVIPDAHFKPGQNMRRADWLGKYVADVKPDILLDIGDFWDFESLSQYDVGKISYEGRRYKKDVEAGLEARQRIADFGKFKQRQPRLIQCIGNHCERINRAISTDPKLHGLMSINDVKFDGWEMNAYLKPVVLEGIAFSHFFATGIMGRAQGGEYPAANTIKKQFSSCVSGHSHILDYAVRTGASGRKLMGLVVGTFMDPTQYEDYAGPQANAMWAKGLTLLKDCENGSFDLEVVSMKRLQRAYGR